MFSDCLTMSKPTFLGFNFEVDNTFYSFYKRCVEFLDKLVIESHFKVIHSNVCAYMASVFSMAWYKILMHPFLVVYHGISHLPLSECVCFK